MSLYEKDMIALGSVASNNVDNVDFLEDEDTVIAFQGILTNVGDLRKMIVCSDNSKVLTESKIIKEIYTLKGEETPSFLKGRFCFSLWDKNNRSLYLATDRFGHGYIYYYSSEDCIIFATEIKAILKIINHTPTPCLNAICDIHNFHAVYNDDTLFDKVFLLPHGSVLHVDRYGTRLLRYWDYPRTVDIFKESDATLLNHAKSLLKTAVVRSTNNAKKLGVMITGGLDSRMITGIAREAWPEKDITLFHINTGSGRENSIVKEISNRLELPLEIIDPPYKGNDVHTYLLDQIFLADGQWAFYEYAPVIDDIGKRNQGIVLFNGYLLDTMFKSGFAFFPSDPQDTFVVTTNDFVKRFSFLADDYSDGFFSREFAQLLKQRKRERIEEANKNLADVKPTEASLRFYYVNRGRRHIYYGSKVFEHFTRMALPGLDYDLQEFAWRLPYHLRRNSHFYRRIICECFPFLGDIQWEKTGKTLQYDEKRSGTALVMKKLFKMKYSIQRLTHGNIDLLNARFTFDRMFRKDRVFRDQICSILLDKRTLNRGHIEYRGVEELIRQQHSGRDLGGIFQAMLSTEFFFRRFIDA